MNSNHISSQVEEAIERSRRTCEAVRFEVAKGPRLRGVLICLGDRTKDHEKLSLGTYIYRGDGWTVIVDPI